MALIISPIVLVGTVIRALETHAYPHGDVRNEPAFWIVLVVLAVLAMGALAVGSIRLLTGKDAQSRRD